MTYGDFFSTKKMSPCYKVYKKIAEQPCYNVIFYLRRTEYKYLRRVSLCLQFIKKCCQIDIFPISYFEHLCLQPKKKLFLTLF